MKATIGRTVLYRVGESDLLSNGAKQLPATIVAVWSETRVNLQVHSDSPRGSVWKTGVLLGDGEYQWSWPTRE